MSRPRRPGGALTNITFRATPEFSDWLAEYAKETFDRPTLTLSQAALWVCERGREYLEKRRRISRMQTLLRRRREQVRDLKQAVIYLLGELPMDAETEEAYQRFLEQARASGLPVWPP